MERDVRITFAVGSAAVAIAVALDLFSPLGPPVETVVGAIPVGTLVALALGEFLVLTLLTIGLIETRSRWRFAILAGFGALLVGFVYLNDFAPPAFASLAPFAMALVFSVLRERRQWTRRRTLQAAAITSAVTLVIGVGYVLAGKQQLVVRAVGFQGICAMFGLFMVSTDIAEIADVAAETAVSGLRRLIQRELFLSILLGAALLPGIVAVLTHLPWPSAEIAQFLGSGLGLLLWLLIGYGLVRLAGRKLGDLHPHIRYAQMFMIVGAYFVALQAGVLWRVTKDPGGFDPGQLFTYPEVFIPAMLVLLVSIVALFTRARRAPNTFAALTFAAWTGVMWFHYFSSGGRNIVIVQIAVAWGSVLWLVGAALFKSSRAKYGLICRLVLSLNLSFALYAAIVVLFFMTKGEGSGLTIWQALIVLGALGWDILTSGGAITNTHTDALPRLARVCFFLSYVISVALMVLVSVSSELTNPMTGRAVEGIFESEPLVATGLILFGPPFFFAIFSLRVRAAFRSVSTEVPLAVETPLVADGIS